MGHEPLDDFMRIGMQDPASAAGGHPEPEVLLAFQADELRGAEAERVRGHLAGCPACRQCVDDFAAIPELESEAAPRTDADLNADWKDLMNRLRRDHANVPAEQPPTETKLIPFPEQAARTAPARPPFAAATNAQTWRPIAATLALAAVGLGGWQYHLARAPRGNLVIADVAPERTLRSAERGPEWTLIVVPPGAERLVLLFPLTGEEPQSRTTGTEASRALAPSAASYRLEIAPEDEPARPRLRRGGLVPDADRNLSLDVAPGFLATGRYRAQVLVEASGDRVASYRFQLAYK